VYGQPLKKVKNVALGVQVYVFANEMQIKLLPTTEPDKVYKDTKAADIFVIFINLYQMINNQPILDICKQVTN
jgi:hypothetical protein